jgi:hypothetical protein
MGWLFYHASHYRRNGGVDRKKELDSKFTENYTVVKSAMVSVVYYAAIRNEKNGSVSAAIILTSSDKKDGFNFGYKDMSEEMGPNESKCPKSILKLLTPTESEYAKQWRERCWAYHKQANLPQAFKNLPIGTKVKWTVPSPNFNAFKQGEIVILEKYQQRKRSRISWVCWDKYIRINPKYVDMKDVEFLNCKEAA